MCRLKLSIVNSIRINNFKDEHVVEKIMKLWKDAANRISSHEITYGVYHEYESNYKGDYTFCIAVESDEGEMIEIPKDVTYKIYKVDKEEQEIIITWNKIWEQEEAGILNRAYTFDYEKYYPDGEIEVYIAVLE